MGAICGASRGGYTKIIPLIQAKVKWVDNEYSDKRVKRPEKVACDHPKHWQWGKGTRNGQKLYYPYKDMYYQKWEMTEKEIKEAIEAYDMFSLEMKARIICKNCMEKETT